MKQTTTYGLNLMESSDLLSAKPLNENAEKIDAVLAAQAEIVAGKLMMATGSYTGDGTRSVIIQTDGFTPKVLLLRKVDETRNDTTSLYWWIGVDVPIAYSITAKSDTPPGTYEPGEQFEATIRAEISFAAEDGSLSWVIPDLPQEYYDVVSDGGPAAAGNQTAARYEWIAFGVAQQGDDGNVH